MNQQRQSFGVVVDGKNTVHVDGSIGKTKRMLIGQGTPHGDDFHFRRATPPELLSLRGYDAAFQNMTWLGTVSAAEAMLGKTPPFVVVLTAVLAAAARLPS